MSAPVMPGSYVELTHRGRQYNSRNFMGICTHHGVDLFNQRCCRANEGSITGPNSCYSMQADGYIYSSEDSVSGKPNFRPNSRLKISVLPIFPDEWEDLKRKGGPYPETIQCRVHFAMDGRFIGREPQRAHAAVNACSERRVGGVGRETRHEIMATRRCQPASIRTPHHGVSYRGGAHGIVFWSARPRMLLRCTIPMWRGVVH